MALALSHPQRRLSRMVRFVQGPTCRHRGVLEYFGDPDASELLEGCGNCDRCQGGGSLSTTRTRSTRGRKKTTARKGPKGGRGKRRR